MQERKRLRLTGTRILRRMLNSKLASAFYTWLVGLLLCCAWLLESNNPVSFLRQRGAITHTPEALRHAHSEAHAQQQAGFRLVHVAGGFVVVGGGVDVDYIMLLCLRWLLESSVSFIRKYL